MKTKFYLLWLIHFSVLIFISKFSEAQISGFVFRDINNDGVRQTSSPSEPAEFGFVVRAYDASGALMATATTNASGVYSFSAAQVPSGIATRLEFMVSAGDQASKRMGASHSNIQFVVAGPAAIHMDFAVASKKTFTNNSNPYVATTAYTNGNAISSGAGTAGDKDNLYVFPYNLSNNGGSTRRVKNQHLGAIFGLAWQRESRMLLMSAYLKRHAGFGPGGIGAIYQSQISTAGVPSTPTMLLDVTTIGINVGTNPRTTTLPLTSATPNTDAGVFAEVGKRGIGSMDLSPDGRDLFIINMYEKKLHRINIGNPIKSSFTAADVTASWVIPGPGIVGTEWHPMCVEMYKGKIYVGGVTSKETTTAHNIADTANLRAIVYELDPSASSPSFVEVLRFPLTYRRGFVNADFRYEFRNNYWSAWQNNGDISLGGPLRTGLNGATNTSNATGIYYPQPMLANIEFDTDGSMILGIRDRFGDQGGYANLFETGNVPGETYRVLATGEVLKAGRSGSVWTIENHGAVTNNGVTTSTPGITNNAPLQLGSYAPLQLLTPWGGNFGPGGGYFYYNHNFTNLNVPAPFNVGGTNTSHYVKSNAGLLVFPGYDEVLNTAIDPVSTSYTNGIIRNFSQGANAGNMSGRMELIPAPSSSADPSSMGKAAALGDLELLLDAQSMEIGNIVWHDANHNGRQDAHETGLPNVTVVLRSPGADNLYNTGDDQVWSVVTDAAGHYYFDESIVNDSRRPSSWIGVSATNSGILPGFRYRVEIDPGQANLSSFFATRKDSTSDAIDNDGVLAADGLVEYEINPGGSTATSSIFDNDYNVDFGFYIFVLSVTKIDLTAILSGNNAAIKWQTTGELNVNKYQVERSVDNINFASVGFAYSKGNGNFSYQHTDNLEGVSATVIYYRIRIENKDGSTSYSTTVRVSLNRIAKLTVGPNPFVNVLNVQVSVTAKTEAGVRIINTAGQVVYRQKLQLDKGTNSFTLNEFQFFTKGMYVVEIEAGEIIERQKLIRQ